VVVTTEQRTFDILDHDRTSRSGTIQQLHTYMELSRVSQPSLLVVSNLVEADTAHRTNSLHIAQDHSVHTINNSTPQHSDKLVCSAARDQSLRYLPGLSLG
jgi:hypothetical protein